MYILVGKRRSLHIKKEQYSINNTKQNDTNCQKYKSKKKLYDNTQPKRQATNDKKTVYKITNTHNYIGTCCDTNIHNEYNKKLLRYNRRL